MDSPAEYVAKLEAELRSERAARARIERERDELAQFKKEAESPAAVCAATTVCGYREHNDDGSAKRHPRAAAEATSRFRSVVADHIKALENAS